MEEVFLDEYMKFYVELIGVLLGDRIFNIEGVHGYAREKFMGYTWKKCS